jgi:alpha-L-rhamnosidase
MRIRSLPFLVICLLGTLCGFASAAEQNSALPAELASRAAKSPLSTFLVPPTRVVWKSDTGVENAESLLQPKPGQATLTQASPVCVLKAQPGKPAGVLLDFGVELAGYVEIFIPMVKDKQPAPIRIRFGESASEAMSDPGVKGAQNDHAIRDFTDVTPWLGKRTYGPSGFRFVRIDSLDPKLPVSLSEVRAVLQLRDIPRLGGFRCSDERLNKIWEVGAYTVHLNMQDYLWDGVKRDRLVWIGDMHPETSTIAAVFGANDVVTRSLDLTRDVTPVSKWMNDISSYSMWWVLIHEQWWLHTGDRAYLEKQKPYLRDLMKRLARRIGPDGHEKIDGMRFLDWPSSPNKQGVTAGLQGLLVMTLESGARLLKELGETETAQACIDAATLGRKVVPETNGSKSGAALQVLAGLSDAKKTAQLLKANGASGVSTFYGFYVLQALGLAGETDAAFDIIRTYWGGMLDRGATTFWEDFDLAWLEGSGRIDELTPPGKKDLHGDFGAYCYEGFRHSFCHGWASGPTAWLSQHVLGIEPAAPGFAKVRITPHLGSLAWAEGSYPTPRGVIRVRHEKQADGSIKSDVQLPPGVERIHVH